MLQNIYETKSIKNGRKDYLCDCCNKPILKGEPSNVHTFYPFDGTSMRTHKQCTEKFLNGNFCDYCGEWIEKGYEKTVNGKILCQICYGEETKQ